MLGRRRKRSGGCARTDGGSHGERAVAHPGSIDAEEVSGWRRPSAGAAGLRTVEATSKLADGNRSRRPTTNAFVPNRHAASGNSNEGPAEGIKLVVGYVEVLEIPQG